MQLNPSESLRQPDTCAYIDVLGQWWKWPDVWDIVLIYGCVMIVNGYVITVPPHNHRMAAAAQWQWPSHAYKKGRDNHLLCWGERQSHGKERTDTHTHNQQPLHYPSSSTPIHICKQWFGFHVKRHTHTHKRINKCSLKAHTHTCRNPHTSFSHSPSPSATTHRITLLFLGCANTFTHTQGECG